MKKVIIIAIGLIISCLFLKAQSPFSFYLTDDNNRMYYETYGSGNTAILFVHGWSVTSRSWDDQIDYFKNKYKVILVDLPGFGKSGHERKDWSMKHYGTDVAGLCKELHLNTVYLVGW